MALAKLQMPHTHSIGVFQAAYDELNSSRARSSAKKCVILLTDGANNGCDIDPEDVADQMRNEGFIPASLPLPVGDGDGVRPCDGSSASPSEDLVGDAHELRSVLLTLQPPQTCRTFTPECRASCDNDGDPCYYQPAATIAFA